LKPWQQANAWLLSKDGRWKSTSVLSRRKTGKRLILIKYKQKSYWFGREKAQEIYILHVFAMMSVQDHRLEFWKPLETFAYRCLLSRKFEMIDSQNRELDVTNCISLCLYAVGYFLKNRKRYQHLNTIYYIKISGFTPWNKISWKWDTFSKEFWRKAILLLFPI
jgi:hypothetical protein